MVATAAFAALPSVASATESTHVPGSPAPAALLSYTWDLDGLASASTPLTSGLAQAYAFTHMIQWWRDNINDDEQALINLDWGAFGVYELGPENWEVDGFVYDKYERRYCFIPWQVTRASATTVGYTPLFEPYCDDY